MHDPGGVSIGGDDTIGVVAVLLQATSIVVSLCRPHPNRPAPYVKVTPSFGLALVPNVIV